MQMSHTRWFIFLPPYKFRLYLYSIVNTRLYSNQFTWLMSPYSSVREWVLIARLANNAWKQIWNNWSSVQVVGAGKVLRYNSAVRHVSFLYCWHYQMFLNCAAFDITICCFIAADRWIHHTIADESFMYRYTVYFAQGTQVIQQQNHKHTKTYKPKSKYKLSLNLGGE